MLTSAFRMLDSPVSMLRACVAICAMVAVMGFVTTVSLSGCDRAPSAENLHDWTPGDHDRSEENARVKAGAQASATPRANGGDQNSQAQLIELTWRQNCSPCHGPGGRGDGPNGALVKAPDLTRADFQSKVSDAEIVGAIKNGKNLMPKFDFSDPVVAGLVARVRALKQ